MATLAPIAGFAQAPAAGTITGHIHGPGNVSVPGVTVQIVELQTGERKVTWSNEAGNYVLTDVKPGTYRLEASLVGFRTDVREPVPVVAGGALKVNVAMVIALPETAGGPTATASGSGPASSGRQEVPALAEEMRNRMRALGLEENISGGMNGTGDMNVRLSEGVQGGGMGTATGGGGEEAAEPSASAANSFLLSGGAQGAGDALFDENRMRERFEEFRQMQGGPGGPGGPDIGGGGGRGMGPGMGPGPGPMEMVITQGGGPLGAGARRRAQINRVRGFISESYGNSALNAHPYPLNVTASPQIPTYREQFGIAVGGPLTIPKIYRGKDKTSFFINYNLQRSRTPFDSLATVPTAAERAGDFSQALITSGAQAGTVPTIYDPQSNPAGPRTPFSGNQIPADRFSSAAVGLLKYIPLPNLPGQVQNFHLQASLPSVNDRVMARIGHQLSKKDSLNFVYFFNSMRSDAVTNFPELTRHTSVRSQNVVLNETHTFASRAVNIFLVNFNRQRSSTLNPFAYKQDISGDLGIQGVAQDPRDWGLPIIQATNFTSLNDAIPVLTRNQTWRFSDIVIWNRGKHNLRFGGELRRIELNSLTDPDARGTFTFSGFTTSDFTSQGFPVPGTGFDFADFLLGLPQATSVRFGTSSNYFRSQVYAGFVQDDWRLGSRLTLNLGLRYEYQQPFSEKYGHLSNLIFTNGFTTSVVATGLAPSALPSSLVRGDASNLAPRIGLAFRPWIKRKVVIRAGYSIFYDDSIYSRLAPNLANQPPFAQASVLYTSPSQVLTFQDGFPQIAPTVASNTYAVDPNFRTPYAQTWNLMVENEIAPHLILTVGYMGTKGTQLDLLLAPNRALPGSPLTTQGRLQDQNALAYTYETSGATSIYHGLNVGLRRQFHGGFSMSGNYTFAKSIDDASSLGGAGRTVVQDNNNLRAERGLSVFDVRQRLTVRHVYEFPLGERKRYLSKGGALARALGNWQISGSTTLQSGTPFTARVLGNLSNNSGTGANFSERAQATGLSVSLPRDERTTGMYFNTAAFTVPPVGQFGNAGRNTIPGPPTINFSMALNKSFIISREKGVRADFRIEAENIFNTPNFAGLATVVNAQDFGRVTSVKAMRVLSFTIRVRF